MSLSLLTHPARSKSTVTLLTPENIMHPVLALNPLPAGNGPQCPGYYLRVDQADPTGTDHDDVKIEGTDASVAESFDPSETRERLPRHPQLPFGFPTDPCRLPEVQPVVAVFLEFLLVG